MLRRVVVALTNGETFRQFVKFCTVGASSAVIDVGLLNLFAQVLGWHWIPSQVLSFSLAVTNGFVWNSLWTFRGIRGASAKTRYARFYTTNVVGLLLNLVVMKLVMFLLTGKLLYPGNPPQLILNIAKLVAIVVVAFWNFLASKYWTFRPRRGAVTTEAAAAVSSPRASHDSSPS